MSLCIAAVADAGRSIVTLSDTRITLGYTSGDAFNKASKVHQRWGVALAGDDVAQASPVINQVREWVWDDATASRRSIQTAFVRATQDVLTQKIEAAVLSPYGLTLSEFTQRGLKDMGSDAFADLRQQIAQVSVNCEFLVFGFDERQRPHIFHVRERGLVDDHNRTGFWAIGSGDYAALSSLTFHEYATHLDTATATYLVCAAKFMAERAGLGRETRVGYMVSDGTVYYTNPDPVRDIWEAEGRPRIPARVSSRLPAFLVLQGSQPNAPSGDEQGLPSAMSPDDDED